jgi:hypothetical protein
MRLASVGPTDGFARRPQRIDDKPPLASDGIRAARRRHALTSMTATAASVTVAIRRSSNGDDVNWRHPRRDDQPRTMTTIAAEWGWEAEALLAVARLWLSNWKTVKSRGPDVGRGTRKPVRETTPQKRLTKARMVPNSRRTIRQVRSGRRGRDEMVN